MWLAWTWQKIDKIFFEFRKTTRISKYNKKLVVDDKKITDQTHILEHIREFYKTLFKTWKQKTERKTENFFSNFDIPKLSENQAKNCEENLTEKDLYNSLKSMQSKKSPGNDGLTK